jgi:hypothetical protein
MQSICLGAPILNWTNIQKEDFDRIWSKFGEELLNQVYLRQPAILKFYERKDNC